MDIKNKKVLVLGLARSGMAAIKLLLKFGAVITVSEAKKKEEIKELPFLLENGVEVVGQTEDVFERNFDIVIKNPGIPYKKWFVVRLEERKIPVITEIELAFALAKPQHYAAITGTNGKTTVTTLTYEILNRAYPGKAHFAGNIGVPLCEVVLENNLLEEDGHYIALEMSNFQLLHIDSFRPEFAVIINLSPDHLDYMGTLDAYYSSKTNIYRNMRENDVFLLNTDDAILAEYTEKHPVKCATQTFSIRSTDTDCFEKDGRLYVCGEEVMPLSDIKIVGRHNLQNVMVAVCAARKMGVSNKVIREAVSAFRGVEHRIEFVREKDGVKFYNDSKGTNTDATIIAVKSFEKGVILLVGGFEKGLPMDELKRNLSSVKKVIGYGACGKRLVGDLVGEDGIVVSDLKEAVDAAVSVAEEGDTILLSPTTSSFDQYKCFEERGEHFKEIVNNL